MIGDARIDEDAIAGLHVRDAGADRLDDPGAVGAHDVRKARSASRQTLGDEQIEVIERGGPDRDAHFSRLRSGSVGNVDDL